MKLLSQGFERSPWWLRAAFPWMVWKVNTDRKEVFLTFDDGPSPGVTDQVLEVLHRFQAKATFFCLGEQVVRAPELTKKIVEAGHAIGNHTHTHCNAWEVPRQRFADDVRRANHAIQESCGICPRMFRPPFGRMSFSAWRLLRSEYQWVMWDVTSRDFCEDLDATGVAEIVLKNCRNGSIVLMHDSPLAAPRMMPALPRILEELQKRSYRLAALDFR